MKRFICFLMVGFAFTVLQATTAQAQCAGKTGQALGECMDRLSGGSGTAGGNSMSGGSGADGGNSMSGGSKKNNSGEHDCKNNWTHDKCYGK